MFVLVLYNPAGLWPNLLPYWGRLEIRPSCVAAPASVQCELLAGSEPAWQPRGPCGSGESPLLLSVNRRKQMPVGIMLSWQHTHPSLRLWKQQHKAVEPCICTCPCGGLANAAKVLFKASQSTRQSFRVSPLGYFQSCEYSSYLLKWIKTEISKTVG